MKKLVLLTFVLLLLSCLTWAKPITVDQAKQVALNIMVERGSFTNPTIVDNIVDRDQGGQPLIYIFNFRPSSFVMVSAEDNVLPILGYSFEQIYSTNNHPIQFDDLLWSYRGQIEYARTHNLSTTSEIRNDWQRLSVVSANFTPINTRDRDVAPLISSSWGQEGYYNALCPVNTPVGCVAVAMGQIMRRWSWPAIGTGSHTYTPSGYSAQTANFGSTAYVWTGMPNIVTTSNTAVATLLWHLGVSVNMQYAPSGSGAYDNDAASALYTYFKYKNTLQLKSKTSYTTAAWDALMKGEIDASRPVYYSGSGPAGGHAFDLDGYQGTNYFHFNWGWDGYYNGYFYLNNLNPGGDTFNNGCEAIIGIEPNTSGALTEGFDGVTAPALPGGWTATASTWVTYITTPIAGTNSAYYGATAAGAAYSGKNLVTPKLSVSAGNTISFYAKNSAGATRGELVKVLWSTDLLTFNEFSTPQATPVLATTAAQYTFNIGNYKTGDYYVAFQTYSAVTASNAKKLFIDTVVGPPLWVNPSPVASLNSTTWTTPTTWAGNMASSGDIYTLTNLGGANLTITSATITGAGAAKFSTNLNPASIVPMFQAISFGLNYEPNAYTTDTATLNIVTNGGTVSVNLSGTSQYNVFEESFESYTDFAIAFSPWTCTDLDLLPVYTITGETFPNQGVAQAWQIWNSRAAVPPMTGSVNASHTGFKHASCMAGIPGTVTANSDWMITPQLTLTGATTVSFWAKAYDTTYYSEKFRLYYSTTTNATTALTNTMGSLVTMTAGGVWNYYTYSLTAAVAPTVKYIGIKCTSADQFMLWVDDFTIHDASTVPAPPNFGIVEGHVYAYGTTTPIANALVELGVKSTMTDASGFYRINNVKVGTYPIAYCSTPANDYFSTTQASVVVSTGATTTLNFGLKWSSIVVSSTSLTQTLNPFGTANQTVTVSNPTGTGDLEFGVVMIPSSRNNSTPSFVSNSTSLKQKRDFSGATKLNASEIIPNPDERVEGWGTYTGTSSYDYLTAVLPERATYFALNDFGMFSNGVTVTQLRTEFYQSSSYIWGTNNTFKFVIYGPDGTTVLFTSPVITAATGYPTTNPSATYTTYTLPTPMTFTDDFLVSVVPVGTTGAPQSLLCSTLSGNSYTGSASTGWTAYAGEFFTGVYLQGDEWMGLSSYSGTLAPGATQDITVHFDAANMNGITKSANAYFVNNAIYHTPRGDHLVIPITLNVTTITTPIPVLNTTSWTSITPTGTPASSGSVFTLSNMGIGTLTVSSITNLSGTDFSTTLVPGSVSLTSNQSYAFGFTYHPTGPGIDNITFNIVTSNGTVTVTLKGYGDYTLEGFEGATFPPDGWANIDQDADTYSWYQYAVTGVSYEGLNCAASASYVNAKSSVVSHDSRAALTPDNYLITPKLAISSGDVLKYQIGAQDPLWPAEHYSVKVSTTNANIASFTTELFAETLVDGDWHERTIDLSAYAHQNIYLAFEHHACTDQFVLKLDNVLYPILAAPLQYGSLKANVFKSGTITPIQNATVSINGLTALTDVDGSCEISNVLVGTYDVTCTKPVGSYYFDQTITSVVINPDEPTSLDIGLTWAELGVSPTSFAVTLGSGETADRNMTITNPGGTANLNYLVSLWDTSARSETPMMAKSRPIVDRSKTQQIPSGVKINNNQSRTFGWYGYANTDDFDYYTWEGTERATKYVLQDLGLLKPVTIQQISTFFYNPSATPWVDATFHFVIYAADGTTVLYTSPDIEGVSLTEVTHTLTAPIVVNGDFYVAVVPTDISSSPFSCGTSLYSGNSYYKTGGIWTVSTLEYLNFVYAEGAGWLSVTNGSGTVAPAGSANVGLHFDAAGLSNTSRSCTIAIYNNSDNTTARGVVRQIPVTFTITAGGVDAPTGVVVTLDGDNPVISWNAVSGASSYNVYGSNDPALADWGTPLVSHTTALSYTDTTGMLYRFYKITAVAGAKGHSETNVGKPVSTKK